ncbi:MAG: NAD-dependent epimerase/dehydratase family protein [Gemmatales bacterium]|nr:NAD-dependent epimerase/dehydratase family protein [Gemmatales bacterium]MDW7993285.1 NAD-dependent epimerase/dehydratase family protein [Gemmatales bacterium]
MTLHLVTGATGLLGSHLAEQLVKRGERVRALVRPGADCRFLSQLGVEIAWGDLTRPETVRAACFGVDVVYHAGGKVGDWGSWPEFRRHTVEGTHHVVQACLANRVRRLVHISSTSAYGHPQPDGREITEAWPLGQTCWVWDYYTRAKILAEKIVWRAWREHALPVTVIRPSWLYGPYDRTSIHRLARSLRWGLCWLIGSGTNRINSVYAGNVAEACILAAEKPQAVGQAYNITNDGAPITQREYLAQFAQELGYPVPRRGIPYRVAFVAAFLLEATFRAWQIRQPPFVTRYAVWLLGRDLVYSTRKAEQELGWRPSVSFEEGVHRTVAWYRQISRA